MYAFVCMYVCMYVMMTDSVAKHSLMFYSGKIGIRQTHELKVITHLFIQPKISEQDKNKIDKNTAYVHKD